jgi:hypothetical protein
MECQVNIPQSGPSEQKVKFYREVANAFEFLAIYYTLNKEQQLELLQYLTKLTGGNNGKVS